MPENDYESEFKILQQVLSLFSKVSPAAQQRMIRAITAFVTDPEVEREMEALSNTEEARGGRSPRILKFAEDRTPGPKDFIMVKRPSTDVERVAALAYYLTHYRDQDQFKTSDLVALNLEAGQPRIGNATRATENAFRSGYLIQGSRGAKKLSAHGEQYIQALPDREAARQTMQEAIKSLRYRRRKRK